MRQPYQRRGVIIECFLFRVRFAFSCQVAASNSNRFPAASGTVRTMAPNVSRCEVMEIFGEKNLGGGVCV
jgi:hypothetical protein